MHDLKFQRNLYMMYPKVEVTLECGRTLNTNKSFCIYCRKGVGIYEEKNRILFLCLRCHLDQNLCGTRSEETVVI